MKSDKWRMIASVMAKATLTSWVIFLISLYYLPWDGPYQVLLATLGYFISAPVFVRMINDNPESRYYTVLAERKSRSKYTAIIWAIGLVFVVIAYLLFWAYVFAVVDKIVF